MIKFTVNGRTHTWNYKRFGRNIAPIAFVLVWFAVYALVSTMEFGGLVK